MPQERGSEKQGIVDHYSTLSNDKTNKIFKLHSYIKGEGNGKPLQFSCLESPMVGGAWRIAVRGFAQSWLKQLSSSSSSSYIKHFLETKKKNYYLFLVFLL